ncbi:conserved hypothetical protein [Leishmania major strain Friedlin]|uniref:Uncharacterized protein n=1 Tax=Leishmania major TaxID=5664 RepID=Q4Q4C9_LEIMA|nr:conserved hypothetical protein [Leishmania major strain Friedlin]CAG9580641.1 hypothetical_protein_-_conserved [Leishmania major strain Friedlin]CAJ06099.1 conserved hypothetical protein [Leishmania major strain Friedlin]|eukprot:XP_001685819.1 conserved hypothetical protein [Leishmania major strain Friedlin]
MLPGCPPPPPTAAYSAQPSVASGGSIAGYAASVSALEQRRRMAGLDAARRLNRGAQWRNELLGPPAVAERSLSAAPSSAQPKSASPTSADAGKFGNSIAAALSLRREEREKTLLKRLQQQRKAEEEGSGSRALAEKDMEVGVFVTASYKALLQRNLHPTEKASGGQGAQPSKNADGADDEGSSDDEGPLAAYLRQLESTRQSATVASEASPAVSGVATGDHYERIMKAPLLDEKNASGTAVAMAGSVGDAGCLAEATPKVIPSAGGSDAASLAAPTLNELQDLMEHTSAGPSPTPGSLGAPQTETEEIGTAKPAGAAAETEAANVHSAVLAHAQLLFDTRQAKGRRGANPTTLVAAARRCDERIGASLFASLS